jgi:hypothetical protein
MKNFLREAADWTSEALETACGWALYLAIAYAILFVDFTGRGHLWSNVASMWKEGQAATAVAQHDGVRVIKLGPAPEKRDDGVGMSFEYDYTKKNEEQDKAVVAVNERQVTEMTDSPADPEAKSKDWKRSLKGELRTFTVYGNGEQTSSASSAGQAAYKAPAQGQALVADAAVPQSAYVAGADAPTTRPAIGGRARGLTPSARPDPERLRQRPEFQVGTDPFLP